MQGKRPVAWLSLARSPYRTAMIGAGLGRSREDRSFCLILMLGVVFLGIGPHYTPARVIASLPRPKETDSERLRRELEEWPGPVYTSSDEARS